ncbi:MAG: 7-cyano-7-deazaguanine synthase, partial [archaeon]
VSLISGGIDSAVSTGLALKQGKEVVCVHFDKQPFADEKEKEKVIEIVKHLGKKFEQKVKLYIINYGLIQKEVAGKTERKFFCVLCRRNMLKLAEKIALKEKADALMTGESLGQVASQTLSNLKAESSAFSLPLIQPLLGMDKLEIERLAREFGTLEFSIKPVMCCSLTPDKPATQARVEKIELEEKKVDLKELFEKVLKEKEVIEC